MARPRPLRIICWLVALLLPLMSAHAASWRYDTVHSQILFSVSHDGFSRPFGRLHIAGGWLRFDPDDWSHAATELDIDLAGVDMGDAAWNRAVCKSSLLDCGKHRYAHFVSTRVERRDDHHGILHGTLTVQGVSRPLDLPFTFNRAAQTVYGMHKVAGFSATAQFNREDFGIRAFSNSIGNTVSVWLELEAIRDDHAIPDKPEQP